MRQMVALTRQGPVILIVDSIPESVFAMEAEEKAVSRKGILNIINQINKRGAKNERTR